MNRLPIPLIGAGLILGFLLTLVLLVTLRPWVGPDESANTLLNFSDLPPSDYGRTPLAWVDDDPGAYDAWRPAAVPSAGEDNGLDQFVGLGCASCHGIAGAEARSATRWATSAPRTFARL